MSEKVAFFDGLLTFELRHRHRGLTLVAMMMFKFHGPVKTEGAVAVACCSDLLAIDHLSCKISK